MTTTQNPLGQIGQLGQSIWMDNLTRDLVQSGELTHLIETRNIRGITSNPAIFEKAIVGNKIYDEAIAAGARSGKSLLEIYESLIFDDIRNACDLLLPIYESSNGLDGYVSIEVPPTIALDTEQTILEARRYYAAIGHPNVMIKIPGTAAGLPAVEQAISEGINVNVTLLFSVQSYVDTAWAYIRGLERRAAAGQDVSKIASVASFFLSRIDTKVDGLLDKKLETATDPAVRSKLEAIKGKIAIANAKVAYQKYKEIFQSGSDTPEASRWQALAEKGAKVQRLLWASTGTKNPNYSDVMYVDELVGRDTVNTLPPSTIEACADHCNVGDRIELDVQAAYAVIEQLKDPDVGINLDTVMEELLDDGIDKFIQPFNSLMKSLEDKVSQLATV
ncbi:MAG TPA: transaldolase [Leptolyngbyaceae cyanobacterium M33_DOE_097]|uniref:Transaldolase n=1 Tax=Oscillatoriales cyanobacterium SpSt-418 TaxID=2282169 RepID=A0A7C3KFI3_9CYAN|nr:transaldolase [Leptolyngbyaceae cyanobacterium M33_DOE_097]